ncbi:MAG: hypothetical protein H8E66_26140 [Planctomycetes bacterium]|nr:hypothetical protein [Planctomycetota bacterium]
MSFKPCVALGAFAILSGILLVARLHADSPTKPAQDEPEKPAPELTVSEARRQAKLLHNTYEATLHTVHREYFREGGRTPIPSRVLEDVFYWVDQETHGETRWIAVNTEAMSIDHNPESDFEKQAAKVLATGKEDFELIEDGMYYRAGAVTLFASCLRCHETVLSQQRSKRRVAGLVISIPVKDAPVNDD